MGTNDVHELQTDTPRVEALIDRVMKEHPSVSKTAQAIYYEAVHQELAPLARDLERENAKLRDAMQTVVDVWTAQFERNGHLAPDWVKKARAALSRNTI